MPRRKSGAGSSEPAPSEPQEPVFETRYQVHIPHPVDAEKVESGELDNARTVIATFTDEAEARALADEHSTDVILVQHQVTPTKA